MSEQTAPRPAALTQALEELEEDYGRYDYLAVAQACVKRGWDAAREADAARAKRLADALEEGHGLLNRLSAMGGDAVDLNAREVGRVLRLMAAALAPPVPPQAADAGGGGRGQG